MPYHRPGKRSTHQVSALATLAAIAVWGLAILWFHALTPAGAHIDEVTAIATVTLLCWILIPLYWGRVRWGYAAGVVPVLGLYVMGVVQASEGILFFSTSLYNVITILIYAVATACVYLSLRSYRERPSAPWWRTLLGIAGIAIVAGAFYVVLSTQKDALYSRMTTWTQDRIERGLDRRDRQPLDAKIAYLVDMGDIPSLAAGIVVNDELVWSGAYGEQPDIDTRYNVGSITKPVVATAVLQLYDRGLLDLNDDVNEYLPFTMRHPGYPDIPITILMLLTHRSGLAHTQAQYWSYMRTGELSDWESQHRGRSIYGPITPYDPHPPFAEFLPGYLTPGGPYHSFHVWSTEKPGTGYAYSSPGYDILGVIVERVAGQDLIEYLRANVFGPLGMAHTGYRATDTPDRQAVPYDQVYGILVKTHVRFPLYDRERIGGGGLNSTVPDMARFMIAHLNRGQVDGYRLLKPETVALMHRQRVNAPVDVGMAGYGLGFSTMRTQPWEFYGHFYDFHGSTGHGGSDYGYLSRLFFVEQDRGGYGIIVLANTSKYFKSDLAWFFATYLKIDNLLMQESKERFLSSQ